MVPPTHVEDFIQCMLRYVMKPAQRHRSLMRGLCCRRCSFPRDVIDQVTTFSRPARAARALHTDRAKAINADTRPARLIIYIYTAFNEFVVGLLHTGPHEARGSGRAKKQNSGEAHGKSQPPGPSFNRRSPSGKDLQSAIKENRGQRILSRTMRNRVGQRNSTRRSARARRQFADWPKLLAVAESHIAHVAVKGVESHRFQTRCLSALPYRFRKGRFGAFTAHRSHNMH